MTHAKTEPDHAAPHGGLRLDAPIRSERLVLRPFTPDDLAFVLDVFSRPEVVRYLYEEPCDEDGARRLLASRVGRTTLAEEGDAVKFAVVPAGAERPVGEVSLAWRSVEHRQGEIGFVLHPGAGGHGYATEAAAAVLEVAFCDLGLHRVIGRCDERNAPSARVMERIGMRREAHFREGELFKGAWGGELVYAILAREWPALHTRRGPSTGPRA